MRRILGRGSLWSTREDKAAFSPYLRRLRQAVKEDTMKKLGKTEE